MRIVVGCERAGLNLKSAIMEFIAQEGHSYEDLGCYDTAAVDYPDIGGEVAQAAAEGRCDHDRPVWGTEIGPCLS